MYEAIGHSPHDYSITEGVRSAKRQAELYDKGLSLTMNSRHLTGHAVDIAIIKEGKAVWDFKLYEEVATHIEAVALLCDVALVWGGRWRGLRDGPHYELNRKVYA
jgi:peptidoglycan L-alanyl-D-glutamate endopeptidase CwlK